METATRPKGQSGTERRPGGGRGVLEGAFLLLEAMEQTGEAGLTELASDAGLPKATTHRLLEQLVRLGAVERSDGRYRIGARMSRLGHAWRPSSRLRVAVRVPAGLLAARTRASVAVVVPTAGGVVVAGTVRGEAHEIFQVRTGVPLPPSTAAARLLTATRTDDRIPPGLSTADWRRTVAAIRRDGVAFDRAEVVAELACVAAPVREAGGAVVAAIGVVVPAERRLEPIVDTVRHAAGEITRNLRRAV
jgi:IclR family transcriptional regulator, acetate operon repressor